MRENDPTRHVWDACYVFFVGIILACYWISYYMKLLSPLPFKFPLTIIAAPFCGALIYFFMKDLRKAFYSSFVMCIIACIIAGVFILIPSYHGLLDLQIGVHLSLRLSVIMALFVLPFAIGGSFVAAWLYVE